jgi:hypothetical protein
MSARHAAVLGGPSSGKSTWLGALWDGAQLGDGGFEPDGVATDLEAADRLAEPLRGGRYPDRTSLEARALDIALPLRTRPPLPEARLTLATADHPGEELDLVFADRRWTQAWQARGTTGALLLFIAPPSVIPLPRLPAGGPPAPTDPGGPGTSPEALGFADLAEPPPRPGAPAAHEPVRVPTVLALVELVQLLRHARGLEPGERPPTGELRVAVLFSQWDAIDPRWQALGPEQLLQQEYALLDDLLWSNFHPTDVRVFGLSTTGGDLRDPRHRERYLDEQKGYVTWTDPEDPRSPKRADDPSLPLAWALFGEPGLRR